MKEVYFNYDINSHIRIKSYHLEEKEFRKYVSIEVFNLGRVPIKSLKLLAYGKDQDGNDVLFNGINRYLLSFNDLNIKDHGTIIGLLPANEITEITLQEYSIEYKDGSSVGYQGEQLIEYTLQQYEKEDGLEKIQEQNKKYKYKPIELGDGWVCACGRYNIRQSCVVCQSDKDTVLSLFDHLEMLDHPKGKPVITENEWVCSCGRFNTTEVCSNCGKKKKYISYTTTSNFKKKKKKKWMKLIGIVSTILVTCILAGVIYFKTTIQTYDNPDMMAEAILGTYSYQSKDDKEFGMFNITEEAVSYKLDMTYKDKESGSYNCSNFGNVEVNSYGYKLGTAFTDIGMIHFNKDGDIIYKGKTYKKLGSDSTWIHKLIRGNHMIQFLKNFEATCIVNSKGYKAVGELKNYSDIKIYGATLLVKNDNGTYMVLVELDKALEPGESISYTTYKISEIESSIADGLEIFCVDF